MVQASGGVLQTSKQQTVLYSPTGFLLFEMVMLTVFLISGYGLIRRRRYLALLQQQRYSRLAQISSMSSTGANQSSSSNSAQSAGSSTTTVNIPPQRESSSVLTPTSTHPKGRIPNG